MGEECKYLLLELETEEKTNVIEKVMKARE